MGFGLGHHRLGQCGRSQQLCLESIMDLSGVPHPQKAKATASICFSQSGWFAYQQPDCGWCGRHPGPAHWRTA